MIHALKRDRYAWAIVLLAMALTMFIYWKGLYGSFVFDDFPNIVDNKGVQPATATVGTLVNAALSSPSSDFKRPLASLSFAANFLVTGLDPFWMKFTNVILHLVNGILLFLLGRRLIYTESLLRRPERTSPAKFTINHVSLIAAILATAWLVLPINLTAVLYTVQRMESLANVFVMLGLNLYVSARLHMRDAARYNAKLVSASHRWIILAIIALTIPTAVGILAKETAALLPLYALLAEWVLFDFRTACTPSTNAPRDWRILTLFSLVLVLPMLVGVAIVVPNIIKPATWAVRDFNLPERLLSEARIVLDYVQWIFIPRSNDLSFYHDDFIISKGIFTPWTTAASIVLLVAMFAMGLLLRKRHPLIGLGVLWYLAGHVLTATIIPLELIYEHRNYFSSIGAMLAVVPGLCALSHQNTHLVVARRTGLAALILIWAATTWLTASAWGSPISLAEELALRAPESPRAQYELGRTYIIASKYEPSSPFAPLVYPPLERASKLPGSSILPEQALIFFNSRMKLPLQQSWWDSMIGKLAAHRPTIQDESSLIALVQCESDDRCDLPDEPMMRAFTAALAHPQPSARLLATYADYIWMSTSDVATAYRYARMAVDAAPAEPAYRVTLGRWAVSLGDAPEAVRQLAALRHLNYGGRLDQDVATLAHAIDHIHDPKQQPPDDE